jgi:hypothetical protein
MLIIYDIKREFPTEWHKFLYPATAADDQALVLGNLPGRLPYYTQRFATKKVSKIEVVALMKDNAQAYQVMVPPLGSAEADWLSMTAGTTYSGLHNVVAGRTGSEVDLNTWTIKIKEDGAHDFKSLPIDAIEELFLIINYTISWYVNRTRDKK